MLTYLLQPTPLYQALDRPLLQLGEFYLSDGFYPEGRPFIELTQASTELDE